MAKKLDEIVATLYKERRQRIEARALEWATSKDPRVMVGTISIQPDSSHGDPHETV